MTPGRGFPTRRSIALRVAEIYKKDESAAVREVTSDTTTDWRKRVRVEHTRDIAKMPLAGFEDREDHRIPFASVN
jgi:hypothetical protein